MHDLSRFLEAQESDYETALTEIKNGRKTTHWIWYIFPQLKDLGSSPNAKYYGIENLDEAKAYLKNETLRERLLEISQALLELEDDNIKRIMGSAIDARKLLSSMTLFHPQIGCRRFSCIRNNNLAWPREHPCPHHRTALFDTRHI